MTEGQHASELQAQLDKQKYGQGRGPAARLRHWRSLRHLEQRRQLHARRYRDRMGR